MQLLDISRRFIQLLDKLNSTLEFSKFIYLDQNKHCKI